MQRSVHVRLSRVVVMSIIAVVVELPGAFAQAPASPHATPSAPPAGTSSSQPATPSAPPSGVSAQPSAPPAGTPSSPSTFKATPAGSSGQPAAPGAPATGTPPPASTPSAQPSGASTQPTTPGAAPAPQAPSAPAPAGGGVDLELTAPAASSTAPSATPAAQAAPTKGVEPQAAAAAAATPESATTAPTAEAAGELPAPQPEIEAQPPVESPLDSVLAKAGYPLTPGVSALGYPDEIVVSGYLQAQYEYHADSSDQLQQGGPPLNRNRFVLRRGRIKVGRDWEWAQVLVEVDGNTTKGPGAHLQKGEASLIYGRSHDRDQPPIAQLTLGQFDLPFGFEMVYVPKVRWFTERTTGSRALFPGEPDVGMRLSGALGFARYAIAVTNGEPLDEKNGFSLQDPNSNKDVTARFGAEVKTSPDFVVAGGVSFNQGKGFHPGTDATKDMIQWQDKDENGKIAATTELSANPADTGLRSENFTRWGVGADLEFLFHSKLGWSMLYGELVAATNLDRGLFIADPVSASDFRELTYYFALTQEITRYGVVGFRYDFYDPNSDFLDKRGSKFIPASQHIRTYSPLVGLTLPGYTRLVFQWDIIRDKLARNSSGKPSDFKNNEWTLRLQGSL